MMPQPLVWARRPGLLANAAPDTHTAAATAAAQGARLAVLADQQTRSASRADTPKPLADAERWQAWEQGEKHGYTDGVRYGTLTGFCWGLVVGCTLVAAALHLGVWAG
jgi:hypothetical protein